MQAKLVALTGGAGGGGAGGAGGADGAGDAGGVGGGAAACHPLFCVRFSCVDGMLMDGFSDFQIVALFLHCISVLVGDGAEEALLSRLVEIFQCCAFSSFHFFLIYFEYSARSPR